MIPRDEWTDLDAETIDVEPAALGGPVDPPDEHRTIYADVVQRSDEPLAPIVPAVWRNPTQRREVLRWYAWYAGYKARFHAVRSPKYAAKTALYAPRGAGRLVVRTVRWASADEGNWQLRQAAAQRNDPDTWLKLDRTRERQSRWRWWLVAGLTAVLAVVVLVARVTAPSWLLALAVVVLLPVLARHGRPADKPITDRVTHGPRFTKLTGEMVRNAVARLGIQGLREPGDVTFPPPGIHRDGPGWLARFNLPAGVEAVDVLERRGRMSSALRLPVDQVWLSAGPEHAGQVDLWVGYLPSSKMGQPRWSLLAPTARTSVFEPAEFGTDERQRSVKTVLFARNFLLGGVPGSGKSYAARTLAMVAALDPTCELRIAEFKGTADFGDLAPLCSAYVCGVDDEAIDGGRAILAWGLAEAERRGRRIRAARERGDAPEGKVTPELAAKAGSGLHPVLILIDEAHELLVDKEAASAAERLIKRGRALGIIVVLATQIPDKSAVPPSITRCVTVRWCLAVQDQVANDMILGTGAYKRGLTATAYRPGLDAGWGIVTGLDSPTAARSHYPGPEESAALVARATALRHGTVVGGDGDQVQLRDTLGDVLHVFAHLGRPGIQWAEMPALLAQAHGDHYASHTAESLSALLRGLGVPSVDIKVDGRAAKGCRRDAITEAIRRREITAS
jgi:S-DNA-T family DNA segregation ATPase FtsK/SpoIIIE